MTSVRPVADGHAISCATLTPSVTWVERAIAIGSGPQYPLDPRWADEQLQMETDLYLSVNADRMTAGVTAVGRDPLLDTIARWKAEQMAWALYMDHTDHIPADEIGNTTGSQVDRPFGVRFLDYGYVTQIGWRYAFGENIAYGFPDAASTEKAFMSDQGHKDNILNPSWIEVGIGVAMTTQNTSQGLKPMPGLIFYVQDFGTRPVSPPPPPPPPPSLPQPGSEWQNKITKTVVVVLSSSPTMVSYKVKRSGRQGSLKLVAFLKRYQPL